MNLIRMADAAFAANIPPGFPAVAGYYRGAGDFHAWTAADWARFPGYKLPVTVPADRGNGPADGANAAETLANMGVPQGCFTALDMEGRTDREYVTNFGAAMAVGGYKVWVYGQRSTVFTNPGLNGYWVADWGITMAEVEGLIALPHVRAVQAADGPGFDTSYVKEWTEGQMWT